MKKENSESNGSQYERSEMKIKKSGNNEDEEMEEGSQMK